MTIREIIKTLEMTGYDLDCETNVDEIKHMPHEFVRLKFNTADDDRELLGIEDSMIAAVRDTFREIRDNRI